jgi:hydrogenase maturation factor HypE
MSEAQEVLTNDSIIKMVNAELKVETIIRKIEASRVDFDLSTDGLIVLKKANVPDDVITAMQEKQSEALAVGRWQRPESTQPMPPPRRGWGWRHHCGCCWW